MVGMIEAAPVPLALETKAVADRRRLMAALRALGEAARRAAAVMAELFAPVREVIEQARALYARIFEAVRRPGYYWRDGKLRRDHGYFRRRAKIRRREAREARMLS